MSRIYSLAKVEFITSSANAPASAFSMVRLMLLPRLSLTLPSMCDEKPLFSALGTFDNSTKDDCDFGSEEATGPDSDTMPLRISAIVRPDL